MKKIDGIILTATFAALFLVSPLSHAKTTGRPETVLEVIKANKNLSLFAKYVKAGGLTKILSNKKGRITVFAPTNAAMKKIPKEIIERMKDNKADKKSFAGYHTINGSVVFAANIKGRRASPGAGNGEMIGFDGTGKTLKVGEATITKANQSAKNGVVHIIDGALIPPSFSAKKAEATIEIASPVAPTTPEAPVVPTTVPKKEDKKEKKGILKKLFSF